MRPSRRRDGPAVQPTVSTHVSDVGLDLGPVHVVGRHAGGGSVDGLPVGGFLLLFLLRRRVIRKSEVRTSTVTGKAV